MLSMHAVQVKRVRNLLCVKRLISVILFDYTTCPTLNVQQYSRPHVGPLVTVSMVITRPSPTLDVKQGTSVSNVSSEC